MSTRTICALAQLVVFFGLAFDMSSAYAQSSETSSMCPGETGYYYVNYKRRNPTAGGFVSNQAYVEDTDDIFIAPTATICGSSKITKQAKIFGTALIWKSIVTDSAEVSGSAKVVNGAEVFGNAKVGENAVINGSARIYGNALFSGSASIKNSSPDDLVQVYGDARVTGHAQLSGNVEISERARVMGNSVLSGNAEVKGTAIVRGYTKRSSGTISQGTVEDVDHEGIANAARAAADAEYWRNKELKKEAEAKALRATKTDRHDKIMSFVTGSDGFQHSSPGLCQIHFEYSKRVINSDYTWKVDLALHEDVSFRIEGGKIIVDISELDRHNSKTRIMFRSSAGEDFERHYANWKLEFGWVRMNASPEKVVAVLNELQALCKELK